MKDIFKKDNKKKSSKTDDDFSEITMDDTDI